MAITAAFSKGGNSTSDTNIYTFTAWGVAPADNTLLLCAVWNTITTNADAPTSVTGAGLTWVQVATTLFPSGNPRVSIWRALGTGATTAAPVFTFPASQNGMRYQIYAYSGVDTSGTNGSGAVTQPATTTGTGTVASATLSALGSANNAAYYVMAGATNTLTTADDNGFSDTAQLTVADTDAMTCRSGWKLNATNPSVSWTGSQKWAMCVCEIKAAASGTAVPVFMNIQRQMRA